MVRYRSFSSTVSSGIPSENEGFDVNGIRARDSILSLKRVLVSSVSSVCPYALKFVKRQ
jgi:hypothetical protein